MKRLLFFLFVFCSVIPSYAISFCFYYDGFWGNWQQDNIDGIACYGNYTGFVCYWNYQDIYGYWRDHPSDWFFKFQINNYVEPSKKEKKQHIKKDVWFEYTGTVEYYISDEYQDIKSILKSSPDHTVSRFVRPSRHRVEEGKMPCVKRTVQARIKIAPYKDHPKVYNIWFDGVGVAIDLGNTYFKL